MNISSVLSTLGVTSTGTASKSNTSQADEEITPTTDVYSSKIAKIAAKYDVTHISLDQVPELARELYNNGLVSGGGALGTMLGMPGIVNILSEDGQSLTGLNKGADGSVDLHGAIFAYQSGIENSALDAQKVVNVLEALMSNRNSTSVSA